MPKAPASIIKLWRATTERLAWGRLSYVIAAIVVLIYLLFATNLSNIPAYDSIQLNEIKTNQLHVHHGRLASYIVIKHSSASLRDIPDRKRKDRRVQNPEFPREHNAELLIFEIDQRYGILLFPDHTWGKYTIPCIGLSYTAQAFIIEGERIAGGLRCTHSLSAWWASKLQYDLRGQNISGELASLYIPKYRVLGSELRVGHDLDEAP